MRRLHVTGVGAYAVAILEWGANGLARRRIPQPDGVVGASRDHHRSPRDLAQRDGGDRAGILEWVADGLASRRVPQTDGSVLAPRAEDRRARERAHRGGVD